MKTTPTSVGWWPTQIWGEGDTPLPSAQGSLSLCTRAHPAAVLQWTRLLTQGSTSEQMRLPGATRARSVPSTGFQGSAAPDGPWAARSTGRARTFPWSDSPMVTADQHFVGFLPVPLRQASANFHAQETEDKEMVMRCALQPDIC